MHFWRMQVFIETCKLEHRIIHVIICFEAPTLDTYLAKKVEEYEANKCTITTVISLKAFNEREQTQSQCTFSNNFLSLFRSDSRSVKLKPRTLLKIKIY